MQGCQRTFRNFYTFRNHIYSMHSQFQSSDTSGEYFETRSSLLAQGSEIALETDQTASETEDFERNSPILEAENHINQPIS